MKGGHKKGSQHLGQWPKPFRHFMWDLLPAGTSDRWLPPDSGLREPEYEVPAWLDSLSDDDIDIALEVARRSHATAIERAQAAEAKGGRLLGTSLALAGSSLALIGYQLSQRGPIAWWAVIAGVVAALFFGMAGVVALEIDRVGLYESITVDSLTEKGGSKRSLVELEDKGQFMANWTAKHKLTTLMQARAWFSRGLVCLVIASALVVMDVGRKDAPSMHSPGAAMDCNRGPTK